MNRSPWFRLSACCLLPTAFCLFVVVLARPAASTQTGEACGPTAATPARAASAPVEMKPYIEAIPSSNVKFEMLPIPGGTFKMGSRAAEVRRSADEGPQHLVTIKAFWMEKTETTWEEYDRFAFSKYIPVKALLVANGGTQAERDKIADAV